MSECRFCSAPLNRQHGFCGYCGSRAEMDLHGSLEYRLYEPESERICPNCDIPLDTIDLKIDKKFLIEKCSKCHGLFFDPGELEMLMERSVSNIFHVNDKKLEEMQLSNFKARGKDIRYVKCPVCHTLMNRKTYGYKSGVMVDHCRSHGYWLDAGELRQLQEWKKAGGELRQKKSGRDHQGRTATEKFSHRENISSRQTGSYSGSYQRDNHRSSWIDGADIGETVLDILTSFFD